MSSKNYVSGRNFEYRVMRYLRKNGYYCIRAYGSKGLFDIIAVPPYNPTTHRYPLGIQAKKNGYVTKFELCRLKEQSPKWQLFPVIAYNDEKRHLTFRTLNGEILVGI